ncbi:MAG: hypothetical protein Q8P67_08975, partial [archaeon]|nr:hypothetical protein [archaeon]
ALLNPLVESVVTSPSDGNHTFLWEKSSEYNQSGRKISAQCLTTFFFDQTDRVFCVMAVFSLHHVILPVIKPVALTYHCPSCSSKVSKGWFQGFQPPPRITLPVSCSSPASSTASSTATSTATSSSSSSQKPSGSPSDPSYPSPKHPAKPHDDTIPRFLAGSNISPMQSFEMEPLPMDPFLNGESNTQASVHSKE